MDYPLQSEAKSRCCRARPRLSTPTPAQTLQLPQQTRKEQRRSHLRPPHRARPRPPSASPLPASTSRSLSLSSLLCRPRWENNLPEDLLQKMTCLPKSGTPLLDLRTRLGSLSNALQDLQPVWTLEISTPLHEVSLQRQLQLAGQEGGRVPATIKVLPPPVKVLPPPVKVLPPPV